MSGFNTNFNVSTSTLSEEAALRILSNKMIVENAGTVKCTARVSDRVFAYEQSGESYHIANFPIMTQQQYLKAVHQIQNGLVSDAANNGMSTNVSPVMADVIRTSFEITVQLEEVTRETKKESYSYAMDADTGLVTKTAIPTGTVYTTLQIVAKSIRPVSVVPVTTKKVDFATFLPAKVNPPVFGEETKATKKNAAELIADFEA